MQLTTHNTRKGGELLLQHVRLANIATIQPTLHIYNNTGKGGEATTELHQDELGLGNIALYLVIILTSVYIVHSNLQQVT